MLKSENKMVEYAIQLDRNKLKELIQYLSHKYHNDESLVSDDIYDVVVDIYEKKYKEKYNTVGSIPTEKN